MINTDVYESTFYVHADKVTSKNLAQEPDDVDNRDKENFRLLKIVYLFHVSSVIYRSNLYIHGFVLSSKSMEKQNR